MQNRGQIFLQDSTNTINIAPRKNEYEISVFGKGYGECIVLCCGSNEYVVIDSFINPDTKEPIALDYLKSMGIGFSNIKKIVITHWHDDHIRGVFRVVEAAGKDIKIVLNPIIKHKEFHQFIGTGIKEGGDNGLSEMRRILEYIGSNRTAVEIAKCNTRFYAKEEEHNIELWTLSPQDVEILDYIEYIASLKQNITQSNSYINDNNLSLVILMKRDDDGALLGGDLEKSLNMDKDWNAIVKNYQHKKTRPSIFKVPHHGSSNGFCEDVWLRILRKKPFSFITTFNRNKRLPEETEVNRLLGYSQHVYVIGGTEKDSLLERRIQKISITAKNMHASIPVVGMVRYRGIIGSGDYSIKSYGKVREY